MGKSSKNMQLLTFQSNNLFLIGWLMDCHGPMPLLISISLDLIIGITWKDLNVTGMILTHYLGDKPLLMLL